MKKLTGILALLVFAGNIASAELLKDFKWDGKLVVNAAAVNNLSDTNSKNKDVYSDLNTGVYLNAGFNLTQDVDAVVSAVKCNRQAGQANGETAANATINAFTFEQAYLNLKGVLGIDHKIGRQYYGNAGDLVIYYGTRLWPFGYVNNGNQFSAPGLDGWTGWYKSDKLSVHALLAKKTDADALTGDTDTDINGAVARYELMELLNVGAYMYEQKMYASGTATDATLDVAGAKADGKFSPLNLSYYGEVAKNYGHKASGPTVRYTGTAFLAGARMNLDLIGKWAFMGEIASGTGDKTTTAKKDEGFTAINTDYRPGIVYGGVANNTGLNNLTTWNLGADWNTPMFEKLTLGGKLYHFGYNKKVTSAGGHITNTIGNELDLTANWQHSENVNLVGYYGAFLPTSKYTKYKLNSATAKDDMATVFGAALTVKF